MNLLSQIKNLDVSSAEFQEAHRILNEKFFNSVGDSEAADSIKTLNKILLHAPTWQIDILVRMFHLFLNCYVKGGAHKSNFKVQTDGRKELEFNVEIYSNESMMNRVRNELN